MKSILSLVGCIIALSIHAQNGAGDTVNQMDENGKKQGYWVKYYDAENTIMRYYGNFKNDQPIDTFFYYYPTGDFQSWIYYDDRGFAFAKSYHPNGKLMAMGRYINQQKDSTWNYFNEKAELISTEYYINGKKYGLWKVYFDGSQLAKEINWENNLENGVMKQYYPTGVLKMEMTYENGSVEGPAKFYHPNGQLRMEGSYYHDAKEGEWIRYDSTGTKENEITYHLGVPEGGLPVVEYPDTSKYYRKDRLDDVDFFPEQKMAPIDDNKKRKKQ